MTRAIAIPNIFRSSVPREERFTLEVGVVYEPQRFARLVLTLSGLGDQIRFDLPLQSFLRALEEETGSMVVNFPKAAPSDIVAFKVEDRSQAAVVLQDVPVVVENQTIVAGPLSLLIDLDSPETTLAVARERAALAVAILRFLEYSDESPLNPEVMERGAEIARISSALTESMTGWQIGDTSVFRTAAEMYDRGFRLVNPESRGEPKPETENEAEEQVQS